MASQEEIGLTYNWVDELFRLSIGETGDYTGAFYQGDFTKSLDQAQADKRAHILDGIGFEGGHRILDIGCGWGPMLAEARSRGGSGVGLTISTAQHEACLKNGLDARLLDYKRANPADLGPFDGVVSVGAFEAFCSIDEYERGEQDAVYSGFFRFAASVLEAGQKLYVQTMMFGRNPPEPSALDLLAPRGSDERILALLTYFYPGHWLPRGIDQIKEAAAPHFRFLSTTNGREDYIQTIREWVRRMSRPSFAKAAVVARMVPRYLRDPDFRRQIQSIRESAQTEVFKRRLFEHERMFFERR